MVLAFFVCVGQNHDTGGYEDSLANTFIFDMSLLRMHHPRL